MSTATTSPLIIPEEEPPADRLYRLTVEQYQRMIDEGILTSGGDLELREGLIHLRPSSPRQEAGRTYRLSVDQYHEMALAGVLTTEDRVELLEGRLVVKMTRRSPHIVATGLVQDALTRAAPAGWFVSVQDPVTSAESEPEPDVKVVRGGRRDYLHRRVEPRDVALVVEVADATLRSDRTLKKSVYARASIPIYWIANLVDARIEVYTEPTGPVDRPDYRLRRDYGPTEDLPLVVDGREIGRIAVSDLLP